MAWIESHQHLEKNGKLLELANILGVNKYQAIGHLHALWWWAIDNAEDGNLKRFSNATVTQACGWTEYIKDEENLSRINGITNLAKGEIFVDALIQCGFLDRGPDGLVIHNWPVYTHRYFSSVTKSTKTKELTRKRVMDYRRRNAGVTQAKRAVTQSTIPNLTIPNHTKPKERDKKKKEAVANGATPLSVNISSVLNIPKPPHVVFCDQFKSSYEALTGQPYKRKREHFVIASNLVSEYGLETVIEKTRLLGVLCANRGAWFTKEGWGNFSIENLSAQWNSILSDTKESPEEEMLKEIRKKEVERERANSVIERDGQTIHR